MMETGKLKSLLRLSMPLDPLFQIQPPLLVSITTYVRGKDETMCQQRLCVFFLAYSLLQTIPGK